MPGKDSKDARMLLHGYGSTVALRLGPRQVRAQACPGPACTALAVLLCSLVQLAGASLPVTAQPLPAARLTPRLPHTLEVFAHHTLARTATGK